MDLSALITAMATPPEAVHPIVVHFAIALALFGVALDLAALVLDRPQLHASASLCLGWGALAVLVAAAAGWFDHERAHAAAGHVHSAGAGELMETHEILGWLLAAAFAALGFWRWRAGDRPPSLLVRISVVAALGLILQGHLGGTLVFRDAVGIQHHEEAEAWHAQAAHHTESAGPGSADRDHAAHSHEHATHTHAARAHSR